MERKYNDLIGDILESSGEKDNYTGKGKPIPKDYLEMDTFPLFQKKAKEAGYLPPWLELQKEISYLVHSCKTEQDVLVINGKIRKHNTICPPQMHKSLIRLDALEKAKKIW
jgi:hypothetical protein